MKASAWIVAALVVIASCIPAGAQTARIPVTDETQLPRFSYPVALPPSKLLVADDATFAAFAAQVGADVDATLAKYDIGDKAALRDFIATKLALQLLAHDSAGAHVSIAALRAAETKPDLALLAGRVNDVSLAAATAAGAPQGAAFDTQFASIDHAVTDILPWDVVADAIKANYASERLATPGRLIGFAKHDFDPIVAKSGTLDGPSARAFVQLRAQYLITLPLFANDLPVLAAYIAKHNVTKPDIWAAREVTIAPGQAKTPVMIGIWDSGVDPHDYPQAMYRDPKTHHFGIAFADDGSPSSSPLFPLTPDVRAKYSGYVKLMGGIDDMQLGIVSPDARAAQTYLRSLSPDQAAKESFDLDQVGELSHGSHVAGIAIRGNPAARIVVARFDDNLPDLKFTPTMAWVNKMAANFAATGAYFRSHHVRVVNMSWGDTVSEFETWLSRTDTTSDAQTRKATAQSLFTVWHDAVKGVIDASPQILFVAAAGNSDSSTGFSGDVPSSLTEPNLLVVGAVNQAGDATTFTSYGSNVLVYADGFHVLSKIPGNHPIRFSGTSMASPNVTNLAAKLFVLDPALTPAQVKDLIVKGADPSADGKRMLVNPKRSVQLLRHGVR